MSQGSMELKRHNPADAGARAWSSLRPARSSAKTPVSLASIPRSVRGRREKDTIMGIADRQHAQCTTRQRSCRGVIAFGKDDNAGRSIVFRKVLRGSFGEGPCNQCAGRYHQSGTANALQDGLFALRAAGGFSKEPPKESRIL